MKKMFRSIISLSALIYSLSLCAVAAQECRDIAKIASTLDSETSSNVFLFCPFATTNTQAVGIHRSNISIVCKKENPSDVCEFNGSQRHLNIHGDKVTLVGFDFLNSKNGAVNVIGKGITFIDCTFKS